MRPAASMARESPGMEVSTAEDHTCRQAIVAGDGETISGAVVTTYSSFAVLVSRASLLPGVTILAFFYSTPFRCGYSEYGFPSGCQGLTPM